jgi:glycosyltransferase involved in cell wall biosynthesis
MRILHLAAGNRWTGAAAPAFAEVEALRAAGVDAHYAYVGGYKLQQKIGHLSYTHPIIEKAQNPVSFARTARAIERLVDHHGFDVLHTHLTYDHWLARMATRDSRTAIARTFHARRVLRGDPLTRSLVRRTAMLFVVNDTFRHAPLLRGRETFFTPPPLDVEQFTPEGADARALYGIAPETKLVAVIGKLSKDRGFEDALRTFARIRASLEQAQMMIIGHGEHRPILEALARELRIANDVVWAGYHEADLAEHYRAADALLFTARGSDEGHRAVLEAMACGTPALSFPIDGVAALFGSLPLISEQSSPESLAALAVSVLRDDSDALRGDVWSRAQEFAYDGAAKRLMAAYANPSPSGRGWPKAG